MKAFAAAYRGELDKLAARKKYFVFLCIAVAICIFWAMLGQMLTNWARDQGGVTLGLVPTPMGVLPFFLQALVPFLMFMSITDLVTVECADGTMKAMICRPVERWKLFSAKILAVMTYACVILLCVFVFSSALNLILSRELGIADLFVSLASYALTLVPLAVLASYAALVALLSRSGTLVMFLLIFSYLLLNALPAVFPVLSEMLFTSYLGWYRLWVGALPSLPKLLHMLLIVLSSGAALFTAGSLVFEKTEC